ncbi:signal recognition particle, SRP19 subunit [Microdochium bolleyi]|uniref:Signal recognition particle, SRP19 subunit n=1 Tax=Microdochium bolleyi TaxID=196109 RepID=A0A136IXF5_9PEZI|nr:signal recognition particle, SRP19 subunit [Microdochium bolleyi]
MSHPRIEEVSESESEMSDPSEGDIDDFRDTDILRQIQPKAQPTSSQQSQQQQPSAASSRQPPLVNPASAGPQQPQIKPEDIRDYQCLYPCYFDANRSRAEGRRVPSSLAVQNPLAREIATACAQLRLQPVFEAHKLHPKDWANPGRVRLPLKDQDNPYAKQVKNKHHLYILVAKHLQANPTTEQSDALRRVRVPGLAMPKDDEAWPKPAVPRGWKMGSLLPAYSAAMTGGGVSEDAFKDMMKEMGGGAPGGAGGMPGLPPGMGSMADMMSMFGGGGGGGGPAGALGMGSGGGGAGSSASSGKKAKKAKK